MRLASAGALLLVLVAPSAARADEASDRAAAEALFSQARQLESEGKWAEACPKLVESQRLDPAAGTLLNLAGCYEAIGRTASAWATYKDAQRAAVVRNRNDWVEAAKKKVAELEPKLPHLTIHAPSASASNVVLKRDGSVVGTPELDLPIPVDPGPHTVEASAPGKTPFTAKVDAVPEKNTEVTIPELTDVVVAPPPTPPTPPAPQVVAPPPAEPRSDGSGQRMLGWVAIGVGAAGVAFGSIGGLVAMDAKSGCTPYPNCGGNAEGAEANDKAHSWATISTVGFIAGGALLGTGAVLLLTAPSSKSSAAGRLAPMLDPRHAGIAWSGRW